MLGLVNRRLGNIDEAISNLKMALELDAGNLAVRTLLSWIQLGLGQFKEGWLNYIRREKSTEDRLNIPKLPLQQQGASILLVSEQGFGDELFFLRFAGELRSRGLQLSYRGSTRLRPLFADQELISNWIDPQESINSSDFDAVISIGDLPVVLGMSSEGDIPPPLRLKVKSTKLQKIILRLGTCLDKKLIGVTWRGGTENFDNLLFKQTPLEQLGAALRNSTGNIIIIQRNPKPGELEQLAHYAGREVYDFSDVNEDFEEMLALLSVLEDYIGVSNTNMHLMAGLAKPARVLIPHPVEWRWMEGGDQSPWFRDFKLYRQDKLGCWDLAFSNLAADLTG
jgi:hypothetical protein